jgi:site-specific DNA recombinase
VVSRHFDNLDAVLEFDALDDFRQLTCTNRKGIRRAVLEGLILDALKHNLMHPDFVAEFIREFHAELNRQRRDAELTINFKRRELEETCRKLDGLIEAIADGFRARDFRQSSTSWSGRKPGFSLKLKARPRHQHGSIPI